MEEKTYIMIKPDGFEDTAIVKGYIRRAGYQIVAQKKMRLTEAILREHYDFLVDKPFFGDIVEFMTSGPVICMIVEGENAVAGMRTLMGATDPNEAAEGTIRKALAKSKQRNIIHGADSPENAEKEIKRFFPELAAEKRRVYTIKVMDGDFVLFQTKNLKQFDFEKVKNAFVGVNDEIKTVICQDSDAPKEATKQLEGMVGLKIVSGAELYSALGVIGYIGELFAWHGINLHLLVTDTLYMFFGKKYLNRIKKAFEVEGHIFC